MCLSPGQGSHGSAHPQGSPNIPSSQPASMCRARSEPPPCAGQMSTPSFRGFPAKRQNDQLIPCSWLLLHVGWF